MDDPNPISRRDLLRGRFLGGIRKALADRIADRVEEVTAAGARARPVPGARRVPLPVHRPPGAVPERQFLDGCTRCGACVDACPVHAIILAPGRFREAAGTPMIDAHTNACVMCADTPCITACEPRVLRADRPLKMGVAWIQPMHCLAHNGSFCTVCSERCPVPGAIEVADGKPRINDPACTGCGVCHQVCPAPINAVAIMPLPDRPA